MNAAVQTEMCKTLRALGLSPSKEHQIENCLVIQLRSSGPQYVLSRLSELSDWRKMHMRGETTYHPDWHKSKTVNGAVVPADRLGSQIWPLADKGFFAVVGALRKSIQFELPTEAQLVKWKDGVRCEDHGDPSKHVRPAREKVLDKLEDKLRQKWSRHEWFNLSDMTGKMMPGAGKAMNVKAKPDGEKSALGLVAAYEFTTRTAPLFVWQFLSDLDYPSIAGELYDDEAVAKDMRELLRSRLSDGTLQDAAIMGRTWATDEAMLDPRNVRTMRMGFADSVGCIGFLQQEAGKLRTVANPNRLVQWATIPLGECLADMAYRRPESCVLDQSQGHRWAQQRLREGCKLCSFDMSSATDRLNATKFIEDYFWVTMREHDEATFPMLGRNLEFFEDCSRSPWTLPGQVADLIGAPIPEVSWTVGQPLGLRPSFPLLTLMNCTFAEEAVRDVDGSYSHGHYACVGDDLIIEARYADAYMAWVQAYNGKINNDKTMVSDRYAEFCSQLVTRGNVFPLKPRWQFDVGNSIQNIDKFGTPGLTPSVPKFVQRLHESLARYFVEDGIIPFRHSSHPAPLYERIGVNTLLQVIKLAPADPNKVSLNTMYFRALSECGEDGATVEYPRDLSRTFALDAYPAFGGSTTYQAELNAWRLQPHEVHHWRIVADALKSFEYAPGARVSDAVTSVTVPTRLKWDYQANQYRKPRSQVQIAKSLNRTVSAITTLVSDGLVETTCKDGDLELTYLYDLKAPKPYALLAARSVDPNCPHQWVEEVDFSEQRKAELEATRLRWLAAQDALGVTEAARKRMGEVLTGDEFDQLIAQLDPKLEDDAVSREGCSALDEVHA